MKISNDNLAYIGKMGIKVPDYDREGLRTSIAHIGLGHFHRSHFLTYMDELLCQGLYDGGVFEIDVVPSDRTFIENLKAQDWMYSVLSLDSDGSRDLRINGPITGYANQTENPSLVNAVLSSPDITLITLTITEKGYCYRDDIGSLDWDNPMIKHDAENDEAPLTAVGCLSLALRERYLRRSPVTIMSCDNVPENGRMLRSCVLQFCRRKYPEIADWVAASVSFPCTMVDRITPGTGESDIVMLRDEYGLEDKCPVHCESFMQWVIEDNFSTPVPDFSRAGALMVRDVKPYELMKIRLLNGAHSALSYPSYMLGYRMVHEAISDPLIKSFIRNCYMEEITSTLPEVPGIDLSAYKDQLISRFSNPHIADTLLRLASDGSKKISNAILRPLEEGLESGKRMEALILALALWEYYFTAHGRDGSQMPIDDPKKDELLAAASYPERFLRAAGLSENTLSPELTGKMESLLAALEKEGVREVLERFVREY